MTYPTPNPDGTDADRRVEVGWSRNGTVQVATTKLNPLADRNREYVDLSMTPVSDEAHGEAKTDAVPTERLVHAWDGQYVDLDRGQINELIRNLRRARDQAYGHDE
jgi:hypothetical protein